MSLILGQDTLILPLNSRGRVAGLLHEVRHHCREHFGSYGCSGVEIKLDKPNRRFRALHLLAQLGEPPTGPTAQGGSLVMTKAQQYLHCTMGARATGVTGGHDTTA